MACMTYIKQHTCSFLTANFSCSVESSTRTTTNSSSFSESSCRFCLLRSVAPASSLFKPSVRCSYSFTYDANIAYRNLVTLHNTLIISGLSSVWDRHVSLHSKSKRKHRNVWQNVDVCIVLIYVICNCALPVPH